MNKKLTIASLFQIVFGLSYSLHVSASTAWENYGKGLRVAFPDTAYSKYAGDIDTNSMREALSTWVNLESDNSIFSLDSKKSRLVEVATELLSHLEQFEARYAAVEGIWSEQEELLYSELNDMKSRSNSSKVRKMEGADLLAHFEAFLGNKPSHQAEQLHGDVAKVEAVHAGVRAAVKTSVNNLFMDGNRINRAIEQIERAANATDDASFDLHLNNAQEAGKQLARRHAPEDFRRHLGERVSSTRNPRSRMQTRRPRRSYTRFNSHFSRVPSHQLLQQAHRNGL